VALNHKMAFCSCDLPLMWSAPNFLGIPLMFQW
jgi:hypothetical protein